jgi:hypothetical protein
MSHTWRAVVATALISMLVCLPFLLKGDDARAEPPRAEVSLTGITVAPTVRLGGQTLPIPGLTVIIPPIQLPPLVPEVPEVPVQTNRPQPPVPQPSQGSTQAPSGIKTPQPTSRPGDNKPGPQKGSTDNPTKKVSPRATGRQTPSSRATVVPAPREDNEKGDTQRNDTVVTKVIVSTLLTLVIAAVGIFAMFFGYILGRKDAERNQRGFYRSLLAAARSPFNTKD